MKKLFYLGMTALMMLFAFGSAHADNAKIKVELSATSWTIGTTAPQFTVTITQATTTEPGGDEEVAPAAEGDALALGTSAGDVAVKVTLTNAGTTKEQVITQSPVDLVTTNLTAGEWSLTYAFVKGDDQTATFENVDNDGSTTTLTVEAAAVTETTATPTFKVGEEAKTAYELAADADASVTVTIVAADGATVYYTTDGIDPTTATTTTGTSVTINSACTLKAIAQESGKNASAVASFVVTKATATTPDPQPAAAKDTVTVSLQNATWEMGKTTYPQIKVAIKNAEGSALKIGNKAENVAVMAILSFTDVKPDTMILTSASKTLLATQLTKVGEWTLAYELVRGNSTKTNVLALHADTADKLYLVNTNAVKVTVEKGTLPKPTFSPKAGAVDANTKVTIACTNKSAKIYYTTGTAVFSTTDWTEYTDGVTVAEACTIRAIATHEDWNNSEVAEAAYTIAVLPADEEGAPALTFTPANTDSVDNNTEIFVTGTPDGYAMEYGVYSSITSAIAAYYGDSYGSEGYPTVTEDEPIVRIFLTHRASGVEYAYYRKYNVRAASDVPMPQVMSDNAMAAEIGLYSKGEKIRIVDHYSGDADAIYYTTDGSKPTINNGAKIEKGEAGVAGTYTLNTSVVIKAIAVKDGKASDVTTARFTLYEDATATLLLYRVRTPLDSIAGKNSPISAVLSIAESSMLAYMMPYTIYYTTDGVTEPSKEAYTENGVIKKSESPMGEYGPEGNPAVLISNEGATTIKVKAYMHVYMEGDEEMETSELDEWIVSQTLTYTVDSIISGQKAPEFTLAGGEVRIGDTLRIINLNTYNAEDEDRMTPPQIYYSLNGPQPSSDKSVIEPMVVFHSSNSRFEDTIVIIFQEDKTGTYAYVPSAAQFNESWNDLYYDKVYFDGNLHIQAICYDAVNGVEYGSDFVEATYSIMGDFPMPVITPDGGVVVKGEEVEISAEEGLVIYYTIDGSKPEKDATATKKYEGPVIVNEALTLKAIAFKAGENDARDSVSAVAEAVFTLVPEMTVKAVGNTMRNDSIIFANGDVAFDMFIKDFTPADNIYKLNVTVWNTADEEDFPLADEFEAADSVRFVNRYYNGKYEATFALMQPDRRGGYSAAQDTTITFYVTENEEIIEEYELTVNPVDATKEGENVVFTAEDVAFDVLVKGLTATSTMNINAFFYTKTQYDTMGKVDPKTVEAADSVRFSTKLADGEYVAVFELVRKGDREDVAVEEATVNFIVKKTTGGNDSTAVEGKELAGVNLYPNPSEGEFNVVAPANAQVEIFNAAGMLVKRVNVAAGVTAMRLENSGIYFVRVSANKQVAIRKVVIR